MMKKNDDPLEYPPLVSPLEALEERERLFVLAYVETADVQKAAARAGIKADYSLLNAPRISKAVNFLHTIQLDTHLMDRRDMMRNLEELTTRGAGDYLTPNGQLDLEKIRAAGAHLTEVSVGESGAGRVKVTDPYKAVTELAKMRGWYAPEKKEVNATMEMGMSDELLALLDEPIGGGSIIEEPVDVEVIEDDPDEIEEFLE